MRKMSFIKKILPVAVMAFCLLGLMGCGDSKDDPTEPSYGYMVEYYPLDLKGYDEGGIYDVAADGDSLYYAAYMQKGNQKRIVFYHWNPNGEEEPREFTATEGAMYPCVKIQPDYKGNLYVLYQSLDLCITKYDSSGREIASNLLNTGVEGDIMRTNSVGSMALDDQGRLYAASYDAIYLFDTNCDFRGMIADQGAILGMASCDGVVYANIEQGTATSLQRVDFDTVSLTNVCKAPFALGLHSYDDQSLLAWFQGNVYRVDAAMGESQVLVNLPSCGMESQDGLPVICTLKDGRLATLTDRGTGSLYRQIAILSKGQLNKSIVTLGTFSASASLNDAVMEFNRENDRYQIQIREYYNAFMDRTVDKAGYADARTRFHLDIVSGDCPDVLCLDYEELGNYMDKGLLEDLAPYLEKSGLSLSDNITESYTMGGRIAALPGSIAAKTATIKSADTDGAEHWTLVELLDFADKHPDELLFNADAEGMLEYCLTFNLSLFVDREARKCQFRNDLFCRTLELCARNAESGKNMPKYYTSAALSIQPFIESRVHITEMDDPYAEGYIQQMYDDGAFSHIGYPAPEGECGLLLYGIGGSYSISSVSKVKDGAWEFIKKLVTTQYEAYFDYAGKGFPAEENAREEYFAYLRDGNAYYRLDNGWLTWYKYGDAKPYLSEEQDTELKEGERWYYMYYTMPYCYLIPIDEELDALKELVDTAVIPRSYDGTIMDIIKDEASVYFQGGQSAEHAAELIENRVQLYLNENG